MIFAIFALSRKNVRIFSLCAWYETPDKNRAGKIVRRKGERRVKEGKKRERGD